MKTRCSILWLQLNPNRKRKDSFLVFRLLQRITRKAVDRFGREDLLVQIYVRDLLTMVMKNAVSGRAKTDLSRLYDELEERKRSPRNMEFILSS
ncbi:hypothetical protein TNCV_4652341 [Trichonephila clavipes]|nr:hypothetical protein TNCV_4652341 [Trichonephila clavipes]